MSTNNLEFEYVLYSGAEVAIKHAHNSAPGLPERNASTVLNLSAMLKKV
jgi:hypothetical protein